MTTPEDRIAGGLLGVHAGDSLGATLEFESWAAIDKRYPPGRRLREIIGGGPFSWPAGAPTDDTDLTVAVLRAYVHPEGFTLQRAADNMLAWYQSGPADIGGATRKGLLAYEASRDPRAAGAGPGSAGNGSLMRAIATGLARADIERRHTESAEISAITHNDPRCLGACILYNDVVSALVDGAAPADAIDQALAVAPAAVSSEVREAITIGRSTDLTAVDRDGLSHLPYSPTGGFVLLSLALAVAAICDPRSFEDVLVDVVHLGGDTDTNGAIAGGLLGARDGVGAIPERWREKLALRDELEAAAVALAQLRLA